ncbi:MAG: TIGR01777 family protein [Bacteroidetes bacterium]|nr:MAG: TIGR01777 family protein [Bacteroidota bacterium]
MAPRKKILITGGSGLIGRALTALLLEGGCEVVHLSRRPARGGRVRVFRWDPAQGEMEEGALEGVSGVVNLAGAGVAERRWTPARKRLILESRVQSLRLLARSLETLPEPRPPVVSASAIGLYGDRGEDWLDESSQPGAGFLAEVVRQWESALQAVQALGVRTVALRIGIVLSREGGALPQMALPLKFFVAPRFGTGRQWYSWIHMADVCALFLAALDSEDWSGAYNAVAPQPVRQHELLDTLARVLRRPALPLPLPKPALQLLLGEMAAAVLDSTRVRPARALQQGFRFRFPELEGALRNLYGK